ncbi:asparaginase [Prochlorococcus sp. MIT 1341]|uniref:asparaginase n=1 Tax=Prochlorococcus sp. MIT 1341 TaxID=3096221 RepID=UPI002A7582A2|nr:asparaginase [Prochlorococcus sp. MIT 1341]
MNNSLKYPQEHLLVYLKRGSCIESVHRVHAVVCDNKGRNLMAAGEANLETFIRSSLKPFQAIPFLSSGAAEQINAGDSGIAISTSSHEGSTLHAREVFKLLWKSKIDVTALQCPIPNSATSALQHNCSGKHAAFLATCKKMDWPIETYLLGNHPLQIEITRLVSDLLRLPAEELVAARDDCGAPTLLLRLSQMAFLFAHLGGSKHAELEQISRSMLAYPNLVAGEKRFDTKLMKNSHGQLLSKGGAEGIQCLSRVGEGIGLAIKVEDGSKRAKQAVALHLLRQLDWITPGRLEELEEETLLLAPGLQLEVQGSLQFQENKI